MSDDFLDDLNEFDLGEDEDEFENPKKFEEE